MLKLAPANYLALTDTLYTALDNVRAYLFYFSANSLSQIFYIVWSIKINPLKKKITLKIILKFLKQNPSFPQKNCYVIVM
jgi:hypothetical protein